MTGNSDNCQTGKLCSDGNSLTIKINYNFFKFLKLNKMKKVLLPSKKWIYYLINNDIKENFVIQSIIYDSIDEYKSYRRLVELVKDKKSHRKNDYGTTICICYMDFIFYIIKYEDGIYGVNFLIKNKRTKVLQDLAIGIFNNNHFYIKTIKSGGRIPNRKSLIDAFILTGKFLANSAHEIEIPKGYGKITFESEEKILSFIDDYIKVCNKVGYDDFLNIVSLSYIRKSFAISPN